MYTEFQARESAKPLMDMTARIYFLRMKFNLFKFIDYYFTEPKK